MAIPIELDSSPWRARRSNPRIVVPTPRCRRRRSLPRPQRPRDGVGGDGLFGAARALARGFGGGEPPVAAGSGRHGRRAQSLAARRRGRGRGSRALAAASTGRRERRARRRERMVRAESARDIQSSATTEDSLARAVERASSRIVRGSVLRSRRAVLRSLHRGRGAAFVRVRLADRHGRYESARPDFRRRRIRRRRRVRRARRTARHRRSRAVGARDGRRRHRRRAASRTIGRRGTARARARPGERQGRSPAQARAARRRDGARRILGRARAHGSDGASRGRRRRRGRPRRRARRMACARLHARRPLGADALPRDPTAHRRVSVRRRRPQQDGRNGRRRTSTWPSRVAIEWPRNARASPPARRHRSAGLSARVRREPRRLHGAELQAADRPSSCARARCSSGSRMPRRSQSSSRAERTPRATLPCSPSAIASRRRSTTELRRRSRAFFSSSAPSSSSPRTTPRRTQRY